jgi:hypothetical protein
LKRLPSSETAEHRLRDETLNLKNEDVIMCPFVGDVGQIEYGAVVD